MARGGLAIGGVALIGLGAAVGLGWWWPSTAEATERVAEPVRAVDIANDSGDVTIRAAEVDRTIVRQRFSYSWGTPVHAYSYSDGTLVLSGCGAWCSADYEVTVPRGTTVTGSVDSGELRLRGVASADVDVDSGSVSISRVPGPVTVNADSGDVELHDIGARISVDADSGSVTATGVHAPLEARLSSGNLTVRLAEPGDVRAALSSGDITLTVPRGSYHVLGDTSSGDRDIDVRRDPGSAHLLELQTSSGDVSVRTG